MAKYHLVNVTEVFGSYEAGSLCLLEIQEGTEIPTAYKKLHKVWRYSDSADYDSFMQAYEFDGNLVQYPEKRRELTKEEFDYLKNYIVSHSY